MQRSGKVKWFNPTKGYGFIIPNDGGGDVFVHMTDVKKSGLSSLNEGQALSFVVQPDQRSGKTVAKELEVQS